MTCVARLKLVTWGNMIKIQKKPPKVSKQAKKYLDALDSKNKQRIKKGIEKIPLGDIKILEGSEDSYRLRIGDWRVIFSWITDKQILVEKISTRGDVYK